MNDDKTIIMRTPVMFSESYIKAFVKKTEEMGHIPSTEEFQYCEPDNTATVENTCLMALSYTAALNSEQHELLMKKVTPRIKDTFKLFTDGGIVLSIYESYYADPKSAE